MVEQTIKLRAITNGIPPTIYMVQGDTGRYLKMYPEDLRLTPPMTAEVAVHRPDGSYYSIPATNDSDNGYFGATMTQALTRPGKVECQLKTTYDATVSTYTFYIMVQESTDGLPVEQLGYDIYDLIEAAQTISPPVLVVEDDGQGNVTLSLGVNNGV